MGGLYGTIEATCAPGMHTQGCGVTLPSSRLPAHVCNLLQGGDAAYAGGAIYGANGCNCVAYAVRTAQRAAQLGAPRAVPP